MHKLTKAKHTKILDQITLLLNNNNRNIFKWTELWTIFQMNKKAWKVDANVGYNEFLSFILERTNLKEIIFKFPSRTEKRYIWGKPSDYEILLSLHPKSYFTHLSAVRLNYLRDINSDIYYLNIEQREKLLPNSELSQENINRAFQNKPRKTSNIAEFGDKKVYLLNGKYSNMLGVVEVEYENNKAIRVTDIERTLIDITVRPVYSGGLSEVLKIFKNSNGKASIDKLIDYLKILDYTYPYHQAIGFYLDKSEVYPKEKIEILKKISNPYDFYLGHNMGKEITYSKEWKLYYPSNI